MQPFPEGVACATAFCVFGMFLVLHDTSFDRSVVVKRLTLLVTSDDLIIAVMWFWCTDCLSGTTKGLFAPPPPRALFPKPLRGDWFYLRDSGFWRTKNALLAVPSVGAYPRMELMVVVHTYTHFIPLEPTVLTPPRDRRPSMLDGMRSWPSSTLRWYTSLERTTPLATVSTRGRTPEARA